MIFDDRRKFVAIGLYDPTSPIRIKVLHRGRPTPIDARLLARAVWTRRWAARRDCSAEGTTGYRCVHGENDGLPGLVLDRYGDMLRAQAVQRGVVPPPRRRCSR